MQEIFTPVTVAAVIGAATLAFAQLRVWLDRRAAYRWLCRFTADQPGRSHVSTVEVAKGVGLSEDRVRRACLTDRRIHRATAAVDQWSVWRKEPLSVYGGRGILFVD